MMGIAGIIVFALGNGMWMPVMYTMPMEMDGMDDSRVGAAFAFMSSCGFLMGFISPILGGGLTNTIMGMAPLQDPVLRHVFGLKWSLFLFGFTNIAALVLSLIHIWASCLMRTALTHLRTWRNPVLQGPLSCRTRRPRMCS